MKILDPLIHETFSSPLGETGEYEGHSVIRTENGGVWYADSIDPDDDHCEDHAEIVRRANIHPVLLDALKSLDRAYVTLLETGKGRIESLGGECDSVSMMESACPALRQVRELIHNAEVRQPAIGSTDLLGIMKSIAHKAPGGMNSIGLRMNPDGLVPWRPETPPETAGRSRIGHLRSCSYCGSMHPEDVAKAIRDGATGEWADRKYGWPHKAYFDNIPNPHAGLPEVRSSANFKPEGHDDWIQCGDHWHEPPKPAGEKTRGKFYSLHLQDASPEDRDVIERHLGLRFTFSLDGTVAWNRHQGDMANEPALPHPTGGRNHE